MTSDYAFLMSTATMYARSHPRHAHAVARWLAWSLPLADVDCSKPTLAAIAAFSAQTGLDGTAVWEWKAWCKVSAAAMA